MKRLEDYMEACLAQEVRHLFGNGTEAPEAPPAPTTPSAPPEPQPVHVPPPQPLPGPEREPDRMPLPGNPPSPSPFDPPKPKHVPLPLPLRPVCEEVWTASTDIDETRIIELEGRIDELLMPDVALMVQDSEEF